VLLVVTAFAGESHEIRIGVLSDCGGAFAGFHDLTVAGAELPLVERGARVSGASPSAGVRGASVDGHPIRLFFGCADGTTESALVEARRLVEKLGVSILVGPLAGDEELALQDYARLRPETAFVNGSGSAQVIDPAPNFFSFHTDGAEWMAGLGSYAYHRLGWRNVVTISDTQDLFNWAQSAGFAAEFCSLGGTIARRISIPAGTSDFSAVIAQIPRGVDGFMVAGPTDAVLALARVFPDVRRHAGRRLVLGTIAILDSRVARLGAGTRGLVTGGIFYGHFSKYLATYRKAFPHIAVGIAGGPFDLFYYDAMAATVRGLEAVRGDLSDGGKAFQSALGRVELDAPNGHFKPDRRHQATGTNLVLALRWPALDFRIVRTIDDVEPTYGGYFGPASPPPSDTSPPCKHGNPPPWAR
jgi:branched-chain amino acid transport system substrate-binding protein